MHFAPTTSFSLKVFWAVFRCILPPFDSYYSKFSEYLWDQIAIVSKYIPHLVFTSTLHITFPQLLFINHAWDLSDCWGWISKSWAITSPGAPFPPCYTWTSAWSSDHPSTQHMQNKTHALQLSHPIWVFNSVSDMQKAVLPKATGVFILFTLQAHTQNHEITAL